MQTRRDQLHAYRFQNRRALAALVTGEPNVLEPPMRRLTVVTVSGIMIAVLVAVGFALVGVFKPSSGDAWKDPGVVIVENDTGAKYLYIDKVLHPVANYASAVLALGATGSVKVVDVDRGDLAGTRRGPAIGVVGLPDSLPGAGSLVTSPWTVCSRQRAGSSDGLEAKVSVSVGSDPATTRIPADQAVLVQAVTGGATYMLYQGRRLAVPDANVLTTLSLRNAPSLQVAASFINSIPQGPALTAPMLDGQGDDYGQKVDGATVKVGQILYATDEKQYFLLLQDGYAQLNPIQTALFRTLQAGPGGQPLEQHDTTEASVIKLTASKSEWAGVLNTLQGLPTALPQVPSGPTTNGGLCAVYANGSDTPRFEVPPDSLPNYTTSGVTESASSLANRADTVSIRPGSAAVARQLDGGATVYLIADSGLSYAAASLATLAGFGYGSVTPAEVPSTVLHLIRPGPALDPAAARKQLTS